MGWKIVEKSVIPKDPKRGSEDAVFQSDWCIAVLDGHSGRGNTLAPNGRTLGQIAVQAGVGALHKMPATVPVPTIVSWLSAAVRAAMAKHAVNRNRPGFVCIMFLPERETIVRVGDCQALIDGEVYQRELAVDTVIAGARSALLRSLVQSGWDERRLRSHDVSQDMVSQLIQSWQSQFCNATDSLFGYGDVNGDVVHALHVEERPLRGNERQVVLGSDGYPVLRPTLSETEAHLRAVLERDPLCISEWPCVHGKRSGCDRTDDCTYVRLERT